MQNYKNFRVSPIIVNFTRRNAPNLMKRLDRFILKTFLPMFAMTFFIVLFIVLMQFLWRYMDDLIGKGLSVGVLAELFFYAAVTMVPMALPLAILLASLMSFGNLGEKSELTAIKASGISLIRIMASLIILVGGIAVGAFFFQNDLLPKAQVKMWTLLFSARQKSPELEIPEGSFYDQIPGYNLYVKSKNRDTGMLHDVMIYNVGAGENNTILLADSARLAFTSDMKFLYLHLHNGEQFENLREQKVNSDNIPFRREKFEEKEILVPFDANFNRLDESGMQSQYVGRNISQLKVAIDSMQKRVDSIGLQSSMDFPSRAFPILISGMNVMPRQPNADEHKAPVTGIDLDSLLLKLQPAERERVFSTAGNINRIRHNDLEFRAVQIADEKNRIRRHHIELIKKYTLSAACIVFLFIGAPLGAIIRKGGLGMPMVISVMLFLVYYIIDNTGFKMAREGVWAPWAGMWLSTFVLLPLGIFVTWKAMNDSSVFNFDQYKEWIRRRLGIPQHRQVTMKEVILNDVDNDKLEEIDSRLYRLVRLWRRRYGRRQSYRDYWLNPIRRVPVERIGDLTNELVECLSDSKDEKVIARLNKLPVITWLWIYAPFRNLKIRKMMYWFVPVGGLLYLLSLSYTRELRSQMADIRKMLQ